MTPDEAAEAFNAAHPDNDGDPCTGEHSWSDWGFNHDGAAEYRLCADCGIMDQQWIAPDS